MDTETLELYVDIYKTANMTTSANHFYLTQSTVSKRLASLERELGVHLFERGKGKPQVIPTAEGVAFFEIAERMLALHDQALHLRDTKQHRLLTLACMNSAQSYTLPPFIAQLQEAQPELKFTLEDHHSVEIFQLLENRQVDLGVTQTLPPYPNLEGTLLYEETYRVVRPREAEVSTTPVRPEELLAEHEVYQAFCDELRKWHDRHWPPYHAKMRVNTTATAMHYLTDPEDWMIVPACIAADLEQKGFLSSLLADDPPVHRAYLTWRKDTEDPCVLRFIEQARMFFCN